MQLCNTSQGEGERREMEGGEGGTVISNMVLTRRVFSSSLFICLHFLSLEHLAHPDPHHCSSTK